MRCSSCYRDLDEGDGLRFTPRRQVLCERCHQKDRDPQEAEPVYTNLIKSK